MKKVYFQPQVEIVSSRPFEICAGSPPSAGYDDKQNPDNPDNPIGVEDPNPGDTPPPVGARYDAWATWDDMGWE
ncbi:MAG: hypothetical protein IJM78_00700 [Prevotella sp.]|nr:hypothetical protein [Prevotella sp.]